MTRILQKYYIYCSRFTVIALALFPIVFAACGLEPRRQTEHRALWQDFPIEYKIATSIPSEFHLEVKKGFQEWNDAVGFEVFVYAGLKELSEDQLSAGYTWEENVVLMTNRSGALPALDGEKQAVSPLARTWLKGVTQILDADIYLFEFENYYVKGNSYGDLYSVQGVVSHEAGHILFGEDHSSNENSIMNATMYPRGHELEKLKPHAIDVDEFFNVYGDRF